MNLTIDKVHRIIGQVLGPEAITLQNFVTRVEKDSISCGVVLAASGVLYYCPEWWEKNVDTPEKAKHVIAFEILKHILGCETQSADWISRVAVGCVINAYLYNLFGFHELPRAMYSAKDLPECLMRPNSRGFHSRLKRVYRGIWNREERFTSVSNVEAVLRILFKDTSLLPEDIDPNDVEVPGFDSASGGEGEGEGEGEGQGDTQADGSSSGKGSRSHGQQTDGKIKPKDKVHLDKLPANIIENMSKGFEEQMKNAGFSDVLNDFVVKRIKKNKTLESKIIEDCKLDLIKKNVRSSFTEIVREESLIPLKISNRDAFKLAMGWIPPFFENDNEKIAEEQNHGIAVYMDVSGSFYSYIPHVLGVLECVEDLVEKVFQFSNIVVEIPFSDIKKQNVKIESTGGTDFDCIIAHAVENKFDKILILTDGYAEVNNEDLRKMAREVIKKICVVIASGDPDGKISSSKCAIVQGFIKDTWIGKNYGPIVSMSDAFSDK